MGEEKADMGPDAVRVQLQRLLGSHDFDASKRNRAFLQYVVDEALAERTDRIKAYTIATSVFGRDQSFDPQLDSIVRIEAGRLRRSLERYYLTAGAKDPIRITIPTGSYAPMFEANATLVPVASPASPAAPAGPTPWGKQGRVIFVMPFEEDGDQSGFPSFTRGFTRQVIVGLTRFTDLFVFDQETTFSRAAVAAPTRLSRDLGADFVLKGGTTISAARFGVEALLIDAHTGQSLWAESFERSLHVREIVRVRDEVANRVVGTLAQPYGVIFANIARDTDETLPENLISYDWVIQFYQYWRSYERSLFEPVRAGLEHAIVHDPNYSEAFACLSQIYTNAFRFHHDVSGVTADPIQRAIALASRAIKLAPSACRGHHALGLARWFTGDVRGSLEALETSHALNPNDTVVMADLGGRYTLLADWGKAVPLLEESFARNPAQPSTYRISLFAYHYAHGRYEEALAEARRVDAPQLLQGHAAVAMAAAQLGLRQEADAAVRAMLMIDPGYGDHVVADLTKRMLRPDMIQAVVDGLHKAGLPGSETGPVKGADGS